MTLSVFICLASFAGLVWLLRSHRFSFGLPVAYLFALLLIHVPGALAHVVGSDVLPDSQYTELGIWFTAMGSIGFLVGVWVSRVSDVALPARVPVNRHQFWMFCLVAGWLVTYSFRVLREIPSLAAALEKGGAIWMLGVLLGLRSAVARGDRKWAMFWLGTLALYPIVSLVVGGFLSYGTTATIIVLAVLTVSVRSPLKVAVGVVVASVLAFHLFLSYFQNRGEIRQAVWGGAPLEERLDATSSILTEVELFDPTNPMHLYSLDARLNQNYFVGLAAARIESGEVEYLAGRSIWEGVLALVPRAVWPEKPVFGGSPKIVSDMTGLELSDTTSWGVGNVMEFQINYGLPGVLAGFFALGWLLGVLDRRAAMAEASGDMGKAVLYFVPAIALVQPNGSIVELVGGAAAGFVAAIAWRWAWHQWAPPAQPLPASRPAPRQSPL